MFISRKGSSIIQRFKIPIFSACVQVPEKMEFKIYSFTFIISYLPVQLAEYWLELSSYFLKDSSAANVIVVHIASWSE